MSAVLWQYRMRATLPNGGRCNWQNCIDEAEANEKMRHHEYEVRALGEIRYGSRAFGEDVELLCAAGWATPERTKALSGAVVTLQREVERLRLALAEEIAGRLDRALSPQNRGPTAGD